jgi:hypothetical protein
MSDCIRFSGYIDRRGYGKVQGTTAQRQVYIKANGSIPDGHHIDHLCATTSCVNPDHLEAVTPEENARRARFRRTHCRKGHPRTPENAVIQVTRDGTFLKTRCRACARVSERTYEASGKRRRPSRAKATA